jgi:hypothetical protein
MRDQKIANALNRRDMPNILSGSEVPHQSVISTDRSNEPFGARIGSSQAKLPVTDFGNFQNAKNVTLSHVAGSSCPMPFLDAAVKRVKELGYDVPIRSQKHIPSSINNEKPFNINVHRDIHNDSYHDPSDYVDLLAQFDPPMAYWQMMRKYFD